MKILKITEDIDGAVGIDTEKVKKDTELNPIEPTPFP